MAAVPFIAHADDSSQGQKIEWKQGEAVPAYASSNTGGSSGGAAAANNSSPHFGLSVAGAFEFGGDNLATVYFQDGSTENLYAGQGLLLAVGGNYRPSKRSPWDVMLTAGYKINHAGGSNGDVSFDQIPVELIGSYQWGNGIRLGIGPVYHANVEYKGSGDLGSQPTIKYKDALGGQVQAGWKWIVLTYTLISYDPSTQYFEQDGVPYQTLKVKGDNFGIRFIYNW